jgi:predicted nucleotidyltransferase
MKVDANYLAGYTGWALERLKAQGRQLKEAAESILGQPVKAIWAVGEIAGDGDFDETSDIELLFEVENPETSDSEYDLQLAIESIQKDVGFIQCYIESPEPGERKILIID